MFIVKTILVAILLLLLLFLYSACKISGDISKEEEKQEINKFYKFK